MLLKNDSYYDEHEKKYWEQIFNNLCSSKKIHWDYSLLLHFWRKKNLVITPNSNLVSNIGFGKDATNTKSKNSKFSKMKVNNIGKLKHPKMVMRNIEADKWTFDHHYGGKNFRFPGNWIIFPNRVLRYFYRKLKKLKI